MGLVDRPPSKLVFSSTIILKCTQTSNWFGYIGQVRKPSLKRYFPRDIWGDGLRETGCSCSAGPRGRSRDLFFEEGGGRAVSSLLPSVEIVT